MKHIAGLGEKPREYHINGVRYTVETRFEDCRKSTVTLSDRIGKHIGSGLTDLTAGGTTDNIEADYVCSAAGKED